MEQPAPDSKFLIDMVNMRMPFGKYKNWYLPDLPEPYLVWFRQKGFPSGKIGQYLETMYEIKLNGLGYILEPIRKAKR